MEKKVIHHFCHQHPLILTENVGNKKTLCYACKSPIISESAYVCVQKNYCSNSSESILHKRCAELPSQILHASHPQHPLHLLHHQRRLYPCNLCYRNFDGVFRYRCSSCNFSIDIKCRKLGIVHSLEEKMLQHQSHHHPLTLMRKPPSLFCCDGCGTEDRDMAYICTACDFWIHKTCASSPITIRINHHHHHLSLAFCFPIEHRKYKYNCEICHEVCLTACWIYYCGDCKYFAHVKCVTSTEATKKKIIHAESSNLHTRDNDSADLIQLPVHDFSELIIPFIIRENGFDKIPDVKDLPASVTMPGTTASYSMLFNYHKHPLSLVSEGLEDEELMMICDVCITPIYSPPYYNCRICKYFVHSACYFLPKTLSCPDSQLYGKCSQTHENHKLTAYSSSELDEKELLDCDLCRFSTNGMVYQCGDCKLRMDIKCASLPTSIRHASHLQHKLVMRRIPEKDRRMVCGCGYRIAFHNSSLVAYYCTSDNCSFVLDLKCVLMLQSIKHEKDKHPLLWTCNASIDHPTDFYCEFCEQEMHPRGWMYHCRECDSSFHPNCLGVSYRLRNIKFGRQFEFDHCFHSHPLTYNEVTLKLRCDTCHKNCYQAPGFECASCNYVVCHDCGVEELDKM